MAVTLPNGSLIAIASGYGSSKTVSAISNANPGVVTSTSHGISDATFVEVTSGWSRLNNKIVRVSGSATNSFNLEGYDTSSTSIYPAGSGTGSVRAVSGWTQISQILASSFSGGEQQFTDYQFLESDAAVRIPTFKSPATVTLTIADDPSLAGFVAALAANNDRAQRAVKITLSNGAILLYNAYVSVATLPSLTVNEVMSTQLTLSLLNEPVRYTS
ncbi:Tail protein 3 [Lysobacter dokdonensis DS-58]|uniref:Tail protein 3 n=1 Tax=Lysobacter dokdonensis DS-58 TaxID=1300345 RepID=A0A0A2WJD8_9GAMM|nr:phage tail protein [Lysobacter dokdonensis]KGQ19933.1 Tail protein 3 [Lysobacter dokdonensis DS-58]